MVKTFAQIYFPRISAGIGGDVFAFSECAC